MWEFFEEIDGEGRESRLIESDDLVQFESRQVFRDGEVGTWMSMGILTREALENFKQWCSVHS